MHRLSIRQKYVIKILNYFRYNLPSHSVPQHFNESRKVKLLHQIIVSEREIFGSILFSDKIYIFALFFIFPYILPSNFALALALFFALVFRAKKRARARAKFEGKIYGEMKKRAKKRAKPETTRMPIKFCPLILPSFAL